MNKTKNLLQSGLMALFLFSSFCLRAQTISDHFFGVNAWMPDTIGDVNACIDPPCIRYGKIHLNWQKVKDSKASIIRWLQPYFSVDSGVVT